MPESFAPDRLPSIPPNVTPAMVWYRLVKDLPSTLAVIGGYVVALVLVVRIPAALWAPLLAASAPTILTILYRSKPAEDR